MLRRFLCISAVLLSVYATAQDKKYAFDVLNTLCSPKYQGRGYVKNGDGKAAEFIYKELKKLPGMQVQYQPFAFPVNTFPGKMKVKVDGNTLVPGTDYMVKPESAGIKGRFDIELATYKVFESQEAYDAFFARKTDFSHTVIVIDTLPSMAEEAKKRLRTFNHNPKNAAAFITLTNKKLLWSVSTEQGALAEIQVAESKFARNAKKVELNIEAEFVKNHNTQNVIGIVKGTQYSDSFIVLTAHYDHLGRMGRMGKKTYFPGANDNASGTAMLLDMARYYAQNPQPYSVMFIAFAGEEAGLIGSYYYTKNPLFPLSNICFLINMDLMATGEKGIMAVNGLVFTAEYDTLVKVNEQHQYLTSVQARPKAANSDHYYFGEAGVKCFFFYLMGDFPSYHDPGDKAQIVKFTEYEDAFRLIRDFMLQLQPK